MKQAVNVKSFPLPLTLSIAGMISAGRYDWVDPVFFKGFLKSFKRMAAAILLLAWRGKTSAERMSEIVHIHTVTHDSGTKAEFAKTLSRIEKNGYRVATFYETLCLGIVSPEQQVAHPIVSLDCLWLQDENGECYVPALTKARGGGRALRMQKWDQLPSSFSIAIVRE